ncbi:MAG: CPBP family intramembrane glutamic endopeptidase [Acidobacteriota bacterium]
MSQHDPDGDPPSPSSESPPVFEPGGRRHAFVGLEIAGYLIAVILVLQLAGGLLITAFGYSLLPPSDEVTEQAVDDSTQPAPPSGVDQALPGVGSDDAIDATDSDDPSDIPSSVLMWVAVLSAPLLWQVTVFFSRRFAAANLAGLGVSVPAAWRRMAGIGALVAFAGPVLWLLLAGFGGGVTIRGIHPEVTASPLGAIARIVIWATGFFVLAATWELVFRGYVYSRLRRHLNWANAAGISAVTMVLLFGDPTAPVYGLLNVFLIGLALALVREATGSILPGAIAHATWNTTIACLLSLPLSGTDAFRLLSVEVGSQVAISGGNYGPEGSLSMTGLLLPAVIALAFVISDSRDDGTGEEAGPSAD